MRDRVRRLKLLYILVLVCAFAFASEDGLSFSKNEMDYISKHPLKCITTGSWEPFNTIIDGKLQGIGVDYWNYIKKRLHLKTKCRVVDTFSHVLNAIKDKKADINFATGETKDRKRYAVFSKPYASFPIVIATRNDVGFISNIQFLKDKKIVVGKGYTSAKLLKRYYPTYNIIEVKNIKEALQKVCDKKAYAAIDILPVVAYNINKYSFANLKISGKTPWKFDVRIMVRKELKELVPLLNRVIDTIPPNKKEKIYLKWISVHYQNGISVKTIVLIFFIGIVFLMMIAGWVVHLKKEIEKRKKLEEELERLATIDSLTSIYNRYKIDSSLEEQIEIAKRYKRPLSIIFFDIDFFKKINDGYGHKVGDMVLKELSSFVSKTLRKSDIFGRWGGEEFLIILPETSKEEAYKLAEKLRKDIKSHNFKDISKLTCSFGVASVKENDTIESIIKRVDDRLYKAKNLGRDKVIKD